MKLFDARMYKPSQVAEALMISRSSAYDLMLEGVIPSVKIGKSRRVPRGAFHQYVETLIGNHGIH